MGGLCASGASMTSPSGIPDAAAGIANPSAFYPLEHSISPQAYDAYVQNGMHPPMQPPPQDLSGRPSPTSATFNTTGSQQSTPMALYPATLPQASPASQGPAASNAMGGEQLFDPHDSPAYNFDLASLNFGNHYGALEFGMLGHMSSGAMMSPPIDPGTGVIDPSGVGETGLSSAATAAISSPFDPSSPRANYMFTSDSTMAEWQGGGDARTNSTGTTFGGGDEPTTSNGRTDTRVPQGYTIGSGTMGPPNSRNGVPNVYSSFEAVVPSQNLGQLYGDGPGPGQGQMGAPDGQASETSDLQIQSGVLGSPRTASSIYDSVTEPYSYTVGFHALTEVLQRRFPQHKRVRIAKAIATIRPSFISCTKDLTQEDLVFMERCFQRTLWEYENFINACATPTIVCRRTGEVAAVGNEFSILTGWRKDVLLGKETNSNVNWGGHPVATAGTFGSLNGIGHTNMIPRGYANPSRTMDGSNFTTTTTTKPAGSARPQPVFLAELLDDDSVIKFYEDFAKLAFGDSRGSVMTRCKLLKYKTMGNGLVQAMKLDPEEADDGSSSYMGNTKSTRRQQPPSSSSSSSSSSATGQRTPTGITAAAAAAATVAGNGSFDRLESSDGTIDCICCWTVRRDVFDIPMLIVMNVSLSEFMYDIYRQVY